VENQRLHRPSRAAANGSTRDRWGIVLIIAGAAVYFGAPSFSAMSFLKAGGGYARLAAPRSMVPFLRRGVSEIVFVPQAETGGGKPRPGQPGRPPRAGQPDGHGRHRSRSLASRETQALVRELAARSEKPLPHRRRRDHGPGGQPGDHPEKRPAPTILTPHPGEMSRLTGRPLPRSSGGGSRSSRRRPQASGRLSSEGCPFADRDARAAVFINLLRGTPGWRRRDRGDVLTGTIAAMSGPRPPACGGGAQGGVHPRPSRAIWPRRTKEGGRNQPRNILNYLPYA